MVLLMSLITLFNEELLMESNMITKMMKLSGLHNSLAVNKLHSMPSRMLTLMMVIFLFFTLPVVSNIIGISLAPLRSYY